MWFVCVVCGLSVWCGVVCVVGVWVETVSISLLWLMQHFPRLGFNATALDCVGCGRGPMQSGFAKSVWRELAGHRQGPVQSVCHGRSRREAWKALYQEALAQLLRFDHRSR